MTKTQFISRRLALTAVALATLSLSALPASAEDAPQPPPAGEVGHEGPKDGPKDDQKGPRGGDFEKRGKEMFEKTDSDKDGFLSKAEMEASQKERLEVMFNKSDLDKDGKLSPEELKKGREAMREKFRAKDKDREHRGPKDEHTDAPSEGKPAQ